MATTTGGVEPSAVSAVRARVAHSGASYYHPLPAEQVAQAQDLAADLLATFARHGIPANVVENVTSITAAAIDSVRWVSRCAVASHVPGLSAAHAGMPA